MLHQTQFCRVKIGKQSFTPEAISPTIQMHVFGLMGGSQYTQRESKLENMQAQKICTPS